MSRRKADTIPEEFPVEEPVEPAPEEPVEAPKLIVIEHGLASEPDIDRLVEEMEAARDALEDEGILFRITGVLG